MSFYIGHIHIYNYYFIDKYLNYKINIKFSFYYMLYEKEKEN